MTDDIDTAIAAALRLVEGREFFLPSCHDHAVAFCNVSLFELSKTRVLRLRE